MTFTKKTVSPRMFDRLRPALITGIGLCLANYGLDFGLDRLRTSASKTILNDLAIGILGALAVFFFLSASRQKQNFESAKERIILIRELNLRIRDVLGVVVTSAMSEERTARLQGIDEAKDHIDDILCDLIAQPKAQAVPKDSSWAGQIGL